MENLKGRTTNRIERLLRRGWSKSGILYHLSYKGFRERESILELADLNSKIDLIYSLILQEDNHISKKTKGVLQGDILFLNVGIPPKSFRNNTITGI
jgi:hypothetical protein